MNLRFESGSFGAIPQREIFTAIDRRSLSLESTMRPAFQAFGPAKENVERLFSENALCVTSGQQPGILTGPLYTVYKALSAAALARHLEGRLDRPVVPVF